MATYSTKYGPIYYDNSSADDYPNIVDSRPVFGKRHADAKLQKAALLAFREAERIYGRRFAKKHGWKWNKQSRAILLTGSWRSFELQLSLWKKDPERYASPYSSGHVKAVAIDVNTEIADFVMIGEILRGVGWKQSRPSDEPWHFSFGVEV